MIIALTCLPYTLQELTPPAGLEADKDKSRASPSSPPPAELTVEEKAAQEKEKGNAMFRTGNHTQAERHYSKVKDVSLVAVMHPMAECASYSLSHCCRTNKVLEHKLIVQLQEYLTSE